jgi:hypothetical protein
LDIEGLWIGTELTNQLVVRERGAPFPDSWVALQFIEDSGRPVSLLIGHIDEHFKTLSNGLCILHLRYAQDLAFGYVTKPETNEQYAYVAILHPVLRKLLWCITCGSPILHWVQIDSAGPQTVDHVRTMSF